ncbi:MAG: hypothetical protein ACRDHK_14995, partial [Actinomycetota bacterium]
APLSGGSAAYATVAHEAANEHVLILGGRDSSGPRDEIWRLNIEPGPPQNLRAVQAAGGTLAFTWDPPAPDTTSKHVTSYRLYRAVSPDGLFQAVADAGLPAPSAPGPYDRVTIDSDLTFGSKYGHYYKIEAHNAQGQSPLLASNTVYVAPFGDPKAEADRNKDELGDFWQSYWAYLGYQLTKLSDTDQDDLTNLDEFRWELTPVCIASRQNCRDQESSPATGAGGDEWLDGPEVDYWNDASNDQALSGSGVAPYDPDRLINTDDDEVPNVRDPDSDNDGLLDGAEAQTYASYPEYADSDCHRQAPTCTPSSSTTFHAPGRQGAPGTGDGLGDGAELQRWTQLGPTAWTSPTTSWT